MTCPFRLTVTLTVLPTGPRSRCLAKSNVAGWPSDGGQHIARLQASLLPGPARHKPADGNRTIILRIESKPDAPRGRIRGRRWLSNGVARVRESDPAIRSRPQ